MQADGDAMNIDYSIEARTSGQSPLQPEQRLFGLNQLPSQILLSIPIATSVTFTTVTAPVTVVSLATCIPLSQFISSARADTPCRRKRDIDLIEPTPVVTNTRFARQSEIESSQEEPEVNLASSNVGATDGRALSGVVTATSTITSFSVFTTKITKTVTFLPAGRNSILNCMPPGFIRC